MRFVFIVLCVLTLQACSVTRIQPETLQPKENADAGFPLEATILIYVPRSENEEKIMMHYGYGNSHLHKPGKDLKEAALSVAKIYFKNAGSLSLDKNTHYVLKLEGDADLDHYWGVYSGEIKGTLFDSKGNVIYTSTVKDSTVSAVVNDENAFFNTYVSATKKLFDDLFSAKSDNILSYVASTKESLFSPVKNTEESVLVLTSSGSGFFINNQGQVVTNKHVISECMAISISIDGEEKSAKILHSDEVLDIAILETNLSGVDYIEILSPRKKVRLGEEIIAIGFPLHGILSSDPSLTTGNISSLSGLDNDKNSIQISSPIQPGNSGGPLINKNGHLVGVVQSKLNAIRLAQYTGDIAQNVNFAINTSSLIRVLEDGGYTYYRAKNKTEPKLSTPDIADKAIKYTVQVLCHG